MDTYIKSKIAIIALAVFTILPGSAVATPCFLAETTDSCARIDALGTIAEVDQGRRGTSITLTGVEPSSWTSGQTLDDEGNPLYDPDWVEFNIVFNDGAYIEAYDYIRFTDRFKVKGIESGQVNVSLWLTDENHNLIETTDWGSDGGAVAQAVLNYDPNNPDFQTFDLLGGARFDPRDPNNPTPTQWWDYHLAFEFIDVQLAQGASIELMAPTDFRVCDTQTDGGADNLADGPCAWGRDIGMVVVAEPSAIVVFGFALANMFVMHRRRRIRL